MSANRRTYKLTRGIVKLLLNFHEVLPNCYTCGKTIEIGDMIFSKRTRGNGCFNHRHLECAKKVNLID